MPDSSAQQFLHELDRKLWAAADKLRATRDVAVYKHVVLGLIFLKYASDNIELNRRMNETLESMARALFQSSQRPMVGACFRTNSGRGL